MEQHAELVLLFLLVVVAALTWLARALNLPYPILLVLGGSALGVVPGVPDVELQPDLVLLIVLPPLLFHAAYFTSLHELRVNARAISLNASALVLLTVRGRGGHARRGPQLAVARAVRARRDRLGDGSARRHHHRAATRGPTRLIVLIEAESLINDGTALVAYRTAVAPSATMSARSGARRTAPTGRAPACRGRAIATANV